MRQDRRRTWSTYGTYLNDKIAVLEIVVGVACRRRGSTGRLWNGCVNRLCIRGEVVHSGYCKERILRVEVDWFQLARSAEGMLTMCPPCVPTVTWQGAVNSGI
jgi:hypothetical protein